MKESRTIANGSASPSGPKAGRAGRFLQTAICVLLVVMVCACGGRTRTPALPGYSEKGIRLIAVLPVKGKNADPGLTRLMRDRILETLYFKGYPKIPFDVINEKLLTIDNKSAADGGDIRPQTVNALLNVDAVLYVTLEECRTTITYLYAATTVTASFELRSGKSGETLWKAHPRNVERNFDITKDRLERTVYQVLEPAIQDVVERALQSLPDGQDAVK